MSCFFVFSCENSIFLRWSNWIESVGQHQKHWHCKKTSGKMSLSKPLFDALSFYLEQLFMHPLRTKSLTRFVGNWYWLTLLTLTQFDGGVLPTSKFGWPYQNFLIFILILLILLPFFNFFLRLISFCVVAHWPAVQIWCHKRSWATKRSTNKVYMLMDYLGKYFECFCVEILCVEL